MAEKTVSLQVPIPATLREDIRLAAAADGFLSDSEWIRQALRREARRVLDAQPVQP